MFLSKFKMFLRSKPLCSTLVWRPSRPLLLPTTTTFLFRKSVPENVSLFRQFGARYLSSGSSSSNKSLNDKGKGKLVEPPPQGVDCLLNLNPNVRNYHNFKAFIADLRKSATHREDGNVGILFPTPDPLYVALDFANIRVTMHVRKYDLYLLGFKVDNGTWHEFCAKGQNRIKDSKALGLEEGYFDFGFKTAEDLATIMVGHQNLIDAMFKLRNISKGEGKLMIGKEEKKAFALLCIMICETARSEAVFRSILRYYLDCGVVGGPTADAIHEWGDEMKDFYNKKKLMLKYSGPLRLATPKGLFGETGSSQKPKYLLLW